MYEYNEKSKLCYIYTVSFIVPVKTKDIAKDVEERFDTQSYKTTSKWKTK